jgi:hypothetical protein
MEHGTFHGRLILDHVSSKTRAFSEQAELVIDRFGVDRVLGEEGCLADSLGAYVLYDDVVSQSESKKEKSTHTLIHSIVVFSSSTMAASMLRPRIPDTAVSYLR